MNKEIKFNVVKQALGAPTTIFYITHFKKITNAIQFIYR
jgi:hypothetical protein